MLFLFILRNFNYANSEILRNLFDCITHFVYLCNVFQMEGASKDTKICNNTQTITRNVKTRKGHVDGFINYSRRFNLKALHRILRDEQPEIITALYDKYGAENPLVEKNSST